MDGTGIANRLLGGLMLAVLTGFGAWLLLSQATLPGGWLYDVVPYRLGPSLARGGDGDGDGRQAPRRDFTIADASQVPELPADAGLYPGGTRPRWVRLNNPNAVDILVTELSAAVQVPVRDGLPVAGCPAASLAVAPPTAPVLVRAHATADVALVVRLAADAPDACKNVHFPLTYSGTASQP